MRVLRTGSADDPKLVAGRQEKICTRCRELLPITSFFKDRSHQDGHTYYCKPCLVAMTRQYKYKLGKPVETWLAEHGFACAICAETLTVDTVNIDHDHSCCSGTRSCGKCVRGPLCRNCNLGIGNLGESVERLRSAEKYLERYERIVL